MYPSLLSESVASCTCGVRDFRVWNFICSLSFSGPVMNILVFFGSWYCPSLLSPLRPNLRSSLTTVESAAFLLLSLSLNSLPTQCPPPAPVLMWELGKSCFVFLYTSATFHALQTSTFEECQNVQPFLIKQLLHQWSRILWVCSLRLGRDQVCRL